VKTYITVDGVTTRGPDCASEQEAWAHLISVYEGRVRSSNGTANRRLVGQMGSRRDWARTGKVEGPDPADPSKTVTYQVRDW
jgi:hypothetical protein